MTVAATQVDPNCALVGGNTSPFTLFAANTVTGVVASAVLSAAMTSWLSNKLAKLIAAAGTGPVTAGASGYLASLFTLGDVTLTAPALAYNQVGNVCSVVVTPNASPYVMVFALQFSESPTASLDQVSGAGGGGSSPPLASNGVSGLVSGTGAPQTFGPGDYTFAGNVNVGVTIAAGLGAFAALQSSGVASLGALVLPMTDLPAGGGDAGTNQGGNAGVASGNTSVTILVTGMTPAFRVFITPSQIASDVAKWDVTEGVGSFTVDIDAAPAADWFFNWFCITG